MALWQLQNRLIEYLKAHHSNQLILGGVMFVQPVEEECSGNLNVTLICKLRFIHTATGSYDLNFMYSILVLSKLAR